MNDINDLINRLGFRKFVRKKYQRLNDQIYQLTHKEWATREWSGQINNFNERGDFKLNRKYWTHDAPHDFYDSIPTPYLRSETIQGSNRPFIFKFNK